MKEALKKYFSYTELRPGQEQVVKQVLAGVNTLAILPTGGGKSLCYQLPALMKDGLSVVISPLIALMRDQVAALEGKGISAARIDSTTSEEEVGKIIADIKNAELKLLYLSPERFSEPSMQQLLKQQLVFLVAVDEAHCLDEWGHSFRPLYISLPKLVKRIKPKVIIALTATATAATATSIRKSFGILKRDQVQTSFYRSNLSMRITHASNKDKKEKLWQSLKGKGRSPAIVYVTRRNDAEDVAAYLSSQGIEARAYHAGMPSTARSEVQDGFLAHQFPVICATIAFGMGVDMPDVRSVIHYHPPKSPEGWIQESGRAGRDGLPSQCEILINKNDQLFLESMTQARQPSIQSIEAILKNVFSQGKEAIVSRYNLSTLNDVPVELLDVLLVRLEKDGWIKLSGQSWLWCDVRPLCWNKKVRANTLRGFSKKDQDAITMMIESPKRVSLLELADHKISKLKKIINLLRELEASGDVQLKMSHSLKHYKIVREPDAVHHLAIECLSLMQDYAQHDRDRVERVFTIASSSRCVMKQLLKYFGENLESTCGKCSACMSEGSSGELPFEVIDEVSLEEMERVQKLVLKRKAEISSPARLARFLCGIYSPAMMRYRLYRHDDWGLLDRLPFGDVLQIAKAVL